MAMRADAFAQSRQYLRRYVDRLPEPMGDFVRSVRRRVVPTADERFRQELERLGSAPSVPYFVKVGANDGITGDPCGSALLDGRWHGVLIEPVPYCADRLREVYADEDRFVIEQVAVGREPGSVPFYYVTEDAAAHVADLPEWWDQLGSFAPDHIATHLPAVRDYVQTLDVSVATLTEVVERNGLTSIALLHIDTEGYDHEVLMSLDLDRVRPEMIRVEKKHLSAEDQNAMRAHLHHHGYLVLEDESDYTAVTASGLLERLRLASARRTSAPASVA